MSWQSVKEYFGRDSDRLCFHAQTRLVEARMSLENAINATPTGKRRNLLTAVNLNLMLQEEALKAALLTRVNEVDDNG
jgi:hypothetical protein